MRVAFRVDASCVIGTGHVMRCLALANELKVQDVDVQFIIRAHDGHLEKIIQQNGFKTTLLPKSQSGYENEQSDPVHAHWLGLSWKIDAQETIQAIGDYDLDWLIVDHYGIDCRWHNELRNVARKIMVIDDLADRQLDCDLLLDQTFGRKEEYRSLIPENCRQLLGAKYALLRPEFALLRNSALNKRTSFNGVDNILITMGGMDPDNVTSRILKMLSAVKWDKNPVINVVLNKMSPHLKIVSEQVKSHPLQVNVLTNVNNMAELMLDADFCVGAAGSTSWERCTLGLPTLVVCLAENQKDILHNLEDAGIHTILSDFDINSIHPVVEKFKELLNNNILINKMSAASFNVCDGRGTYRVGLELIPCSAKDGQSLTVEDATMDDAKMIYDWQCHPMTRKYANNPEIPSWDAHLSWLRSKLDSCSSYYWIIQYDNEPSGVLRFDPVILGEKEGYLISIFIAPEKYQLGIGSGALEIGKRIFSDSSLYAKVLDENKASLSLFDHAGFKYRENISHYEWRQH